MLGRSGGDRLSRVLRHSTIGAGAVNGRVRDGIGFETPRSDHQTGQARRVRQACVWRAVTPVRLHRAWSVCLIRTRIMRAIKPIERLVLVSSARCRACTSSLSTWSSSTALEGVLVSRGVSRLDAFSGYPDRTELPCTAAGATTGPPEVRPSRSSRTRDRSSQNSCTHGR